MGCYNPMEIKHSDLISNPAGSMILSCSARLRSCSIADSTETHDFLCEIYKQRLLAYVIGLSTSRVAAEAGAKLMCLLSL